MRFRETKPQRDVFTGWTEIQILCSPATLVVVDAPHPSSLWFFDPLSPSHRNRFSSPFFYYLLRPFLILQRQWDVEIEIGKINSVTMFHSSTVSATSILQRRDNFRRMEMLSVVCRPYCILYLAMFSYAFFRLFLLLCLLYVHARSPRTNLKPNRQTSKMVIQRHDDIPFLWRSQLFPPRNVCVNNELRLRITLTSI